MSGIVKALEWEDRYNGGFITRMNDPLEYTIERGEQHWRLYLNRGYSYLGAFDSADEAKAAAQADFDQRITATLDPSYASSQAEIERLRAALNKIVNNWTDLHPKDLAQARTALGTKP